ncbi:MAG: dTDP-4-dehydrorhamnose 3,5-epimerase [Acidobacteriaceae bacterium]|nr:dTDP-4-dehydrorhamnose 3,5-epimerase [Acidobacteriaceae bacterium]
MKIVETPLQDVFVVEPTVFGDDRGFFLESYNEERFAELGLPTRFAQDNHSGSRKGVLRGIHYQIQNPQGKLVRALVGEVFDVAVDLRKDSSSFGQSFGILLSAQNRKMLWIPPGFGHGFLVVSEFAEFAYKATDLYAPQYDRTILWNDPALKIAWPTEAIDGEPVLSAKDKVGRLLADAEVFVVSPAGSKLNLKPVAALS